MKERPILFSAPMVRAILAGTKTQTRRVVKPQPPSEATSAGVMSAPGRGHDGEWSWLSGDPKDCDSWGFVGEEFRCPYGQPGDRLWLREAWGLAFGSAIMPHPDAVIYRADEGNADWDGRWKPSIHMPRWASRITLEIISVRVERLRDISEADSAAEGIVFDPHVAVDKMGLSSLYRIAYRDLWESINGPGSWDANPWVWVVGFKKITKGE